MNVLHINTYQEGGAAWCAKRISNTLLKQGINSKMLFAEGEQSENFYIAERDKDFWYSNSFRGKIKHLLMRTNWFNDAEKWDKIIEEANDRLPEKLFLHHPFSSYKSIASHPLVEWADIIHLHWVAGFIDYPSFFKKVKKPIVWTLHDMNPAIGAMHFTSENTPVPCELIKIEKILKGIKQKAIRRCNVPLYIVALSEKMCNIVKSSEVFSGSQVSILYNGVDTNIFKPKCNKERPITFMFSSYDIWDKRKGLCRIIEALKKLNIPNMSMIVVGANWDNKPISAPFPVKEVGLIKDQNYLAELYSEADFFINASYEEGFAQTPLEAMACGTAVISTPCSGASDLIRPFNGVICNGYDSDAIAFGIKEAMRNNYDSNIIRQNIIDNYDWDKIANQYIDLYNNVLYRSPKRFVMSSLKS